jgi:CRP-like cAMP-binding protein
MSAGDVDVPLATALAQMDAHVCEAVGGGDDGDDVDLGAIGHGVADRSDFHGITGVPAEEDDVVDAGQHEAPAGRRGAAQASAGISVPQRSPQQLRRSVPVLGVEQSPTKKKQDGDGVVPRLQRPRAGSVIVPGSSSDAVKMSPVAMAAGKKWMAKLKRRRSRSPSIASLGHAMANIYAGTDASSPPKRGQQHLPRRLSLSKLRRSSVSSLSSSPPGSPLRSPHSRNGSLPSSPLGSPHGSESLKSGNWHTRVDMSEVIRVARKANIFSNAGTLPDEQIVSLLHNSDFRKYDASQFLFLQGVEGDGMYLILGGEVLILREEKLNVTAALGRKRGSGDKDSGADDDSAGDDDDTNFTIATDRNNKRGGRSSAAEINAHLVPTGYRFIANMGTGDSFGEASLLNSAPRNAAAMAKTDLTCLFISRVLFQKLLKWGMLDLSAQLHKSQVRTKIYDIVKSSPTLSEALSQDMIYDLIDKGQRRKYEPGAVVFHEGENGDGMHIVLSGHIQIVKMSKKEVQRDMIEKKNENSKADRRRRLAARNYSDGTVLTTMGQADLFGELALLTQAPRSAAARVTGARGGATTLFVAHELYKKVQAASGGHLEADIVRARLSVLKDGFMDRTPPFSRLSQGQKRRLIDVMRLVRFPYGDYICKQGEVASRMYFIIKGRVLVTVNDVLKKGRGSAQKQTELTRLCKFGCCCCSSLFACLLLLLLADTDLPPSPSPCHPLFLS